MHLQIWPSKLKKSGFRQGYVKPLVKYKELLPHRASRNRE